MEIVACGRCVVKEDSPCPEWAWHSERQGRDGRCSEERPVEKCTDELYYNAGRGRSWLRHETAWCPSVSVLQTLSMSEVPGANVQGTASRALNRMGSEEVLKHRACLKDVKVSHQPLKSHKDHSALGLEAKIMYLPSQQARTFSSWSASRSERSIVSCSSSPLSWTSLAS